MDASSWIAAGSAFVALLSLLLNGRLAYRTRGRVRADASFDSSSIFVRVTAVTPASISVDRITLEVAPRWGRLSRLANPGPTPRRKIVANRFYGLLSWHLLLSDRDPQVAHRSGPSLPHDIRGYSGQAWSLYPREPSPHGPSDFIKLCTMPQTRIEAPVHE